MNVELEKIIKNPYQTRTGVDPAHIAELAEDIKRNGLLQAPVGRIVGDQVQLAFGHNRLEAFKLLAVENPPHFCEMPVEIRKLDDEQMALLSWSENETRQQLNPVERSQAIKRFSEAFGWSQQQVAEKLSMARSTVANMLRLLNLPGMILVLVEEGVLSARQAHALIPLYELSEADQAWVVNESERAEFLQLARSGVIDSDTMRQRISDYLQALDDSKPKQAEVFKEPEEPVAPMTVTKEDVSSSPQRTAEKDEVLRKLIDQAIEFVKQRPYVDAVTLQRQMRISWSIAMRLVEELQKWRVLGEKEGQRYKVLIGKYAPKVAPMTAAPMTAEPEEAATESAAPEAVEDAQPVAEPEEVETEQPSENVRTQTLTVLETPVSEPPKKEQKKIPTPIPEVAPAPEPEKLIVSITWMADMAILGIRREGGDKPGKPIFKMLPSLPIYNVAFTLAELIPEEWKEMIK